ncbi:MAG: hypothetical protein JXA79_00125 [Deltaproteobacteria bacterium]|nr:hypothetical protein [Deltaproteobacteria bacterium]
MYNDIAQARRIAGVAGEYPDLGREKRGIHRGACLYYIYWIEGGRD